MYLYIYIFKSIYIIKAFVRRYATIQDITLHDIMPLRCKTLYVTCMSA